MYILWYNTSPVTTRLVKAYIANINENHGRRVTAAYFLCYLCGLEIPDAVSIVLNSRRHFPENVLPVHEIRQQRGKKHFTMCLSPIHKSFHAALELVEWIELNKIFGIERFLLYVNNVSAEVEEVLTYYQQNEDIVEVLPWSLPNGTRIHYFGQLAALNDCLYRSKGRSHYIAATDLDEFIIPQYTRDFTWVEMLMRLPDHSVYLFGNTFVMTNESDKSVKEKEDFLIIDNILRDDFINGPRDRSKMIAWTNDVVTLGIHNVWALRTGDEHYVDPRVGLLHHYRKDPVKYPEGVTVTRFKSEVALKYSKDLKENIASVRRKMKRN